MEHHMMLLWKKAAQEVLQRHLLQKQLQNRKQLQHKNQQLVQAHKVQ